MWRQEKRFAEDESGLELVEWSVLMALLVVSLVAVIGDLGGSVGRAFGNVQSAMADEAFVPPGHGGEVPGNPPDHANAGGNSNP
ncbi:MAG: Flp family type IVb pilin [Phycisphaeraceae bacterium]